MKSRSPEFAKEKPRRRPAANDVAALAGVSPATVDRVLNRRPNVRSATAQRVIEAAMELRYLPAHDLYTALRPKPMQLTFILPSGNNRYLRMLGAYIASDTGQHRTFNVDCRCVFVESFNAAALSAAIALHGRRSDGIAFMALDDDQVRAAASKVVGAGKPVLTLISDLPRSGRLAYVGLDNNAVGRTAARLIGQMTGSSHGQIGLIAGSLVYQAHREREAGFRALIAERFPQLKVVKVHEGHDDATENYQAARNLLTRQPKLSAIYNIGGASTGVTRALREYSLRRICFVGHGLSPDTRRMLVDGVMDFAMTQSHENTVLNAVRIFTNFRDGRRPLDGVEPLSINLVTGENLPEATSKLGYHDVPR